MPKEKFVSDTLSRKQFQEILQLFYDSKEHLGDDRNTIKVVHYQGRPLVVKSFRTPNVVNRVVYKWFRKSKACRSYENAQYLQRHNIGTPAPVAYMEKMSATGLETSFYVSEYAEHDFTFRAIIKDETLTDKENILKQFTQFMFEMHEAQIYFLDHSPGNTLIKKEGAQYHFYLVDLNRMKFYDIPYEERLKNFNRLAPKKWIYEVMGAEYARLSYTDPQEAVDMMWEHTKRFQEAFHKKKAFKKRIKKILS